MKFGTSSPAPTPAPPAPEPVRIPSPDDPDMLAARRRREQEFMTQREGRRETDLTGASRSSAREYSRTTLG